MSLRHAEWHVAPWGKGKWAVFRRDSERVSFIGTKDEADERALQLIVKHEGTAYYHRKDGVIEDAQSSDPRYR